MLHHVQMTTSSKPQVISYNSLSSAKLENFQSLQIIPKTSKISDFTHKNTSISMHSHFII